MTFTIDGKSALLGAFAGTALVAGLGAVQVATGAGRYAIDVEATVKEDQAREYKAFVIDTVTGDVWEAKPGQRPPRGT